LRASCFRLSPWIVERAIAWLNRRRRLAKDWECLNRKALAFLRLASSLLGFVADDVRQRGRTAQSRKGVSQFNK
jgi:hypothetical protein